MTNSIHKRLLLRTFYYCYWFVNYIPFSPQQLFEKKIPLICHFFPHLLCLNVNETSETLPKNRCNAITAIIEQNTEKSAHEKGQ